MYSRLQRYIFYPVIDYFPLPKIRCFYSYFFSYFPRCFPHFPSFSLVFPHITHLPLLFPTFSLVSSFFLFPLYSPLLTLRGWIFFPSFFVWFSKNWVEHIPLDVLVFKGLHCTVLALKKFKYFGLNNFLLSSNNLCLGVLNSVINEKYTKIKEKKLQKVKFRV